VIADEFNHGGSRRKEVKAETHEKNPKAESRIPKEI
jgi:hypothetical protein